MAAPTLFDTGQVSRIEQPYVTKTKNEREVEQGNAKAAHNDCSLQPNTCNEDH